MKATTSTFLLLFIFGIVTAQTDNPKFEINIGSYAMKNINPGPKLDNNFGNYTLSLNYKLNRSRKLKIWSTVSLNRYYYYKNNYQVNYEWDMDEDYYESWQEHDIAMYFVGLGLNLSRAFTSKQNSFYWKFGLEFLINLKNTGQLTFYDVGEPQPSEDIEDVRLDNQLRSYVGLGYQFKIKGASPIFTISPILGMNLRYFNMEVLTKHYLDSFRGYFYGLDLGCRF